MSEKSVEKQAKKEKESQQDLGFFLSRKRHLELQSHTKVKAMKKLSNQRFIQRLKKMSM